MLHDIANKKWDENDKGTPKGIGIRYFNLSL